MKTAAAAIEFGTSKIVTLIAESGSFTRCDIIGSGTVPYAGFTEGEWNDRDGLIGAIEASVQAAETVKALLGKESQIRNRLLMIDLLDGSVDDMELR